MWRSPSARVEIAASNESGWSDEGERKSTMTRFVSNSEASKKSRLVEFFRWICVLPAAFIVGTLVNYAFKILVMFSLIQWSSLREHQLGYWICYALVLMPKN